MKSSKNLIIFLVIIAVLSIYLIFNKTGKIHYDIPVLDSTVEQDINFINIESSGPAIQLLKNNDTWYLVSEDYRADPAAVKKITGFLSSLKLIDLVSESGMYSSYGLDDKNADKVTFGKDSKNQMIIFVGDSTTNHRFTYVRLSDKSPVYTVSGDGGKIFDLTEEKIIDRRLIDFDPASVNLISITDGEETFILNKTVLEDNSDVWKSGDGLTFDDKKIQDTMRYFITLRFDSLSDRQPDAGEDNPIFKIQLNGEKGEYDIAVLGKIDNGYIASSSFAEKNFILSVDTVDHIKDEYSKLKGDENQ